MPPPSPPPADGLDPADAPGDTASTVGWSPTSDDGSGHLGEGGTDSAEIRLVVSGTDDPTGFGTEIRPEPLTGTDAPLASAFVTAVEGTDFLDGRESVIGSLAAGGGLADPTGNRVASSGRRFLAMRAR
ncbi:hypothetical protein LNKW23_44230 [Paralimibaculum aggregatum]|uniref:Uncharacterized protein n=1 Tax=Paralimibaculum aggregatum TaxID=3036245 RepID=A0ABQ6LT11_9RHOB|nr:hypothetical protein [Limibaculum sp. NKW23]GMG85207.1 hypothetical protein LNKW23_44230 [Limibaculum sp. NKW23]